MFIKISSDKNTKDLCALTGEDVKCNICDKEIDLSEQLFSCPKCSNIGHLSCLNPDESPNPDEPPISDESSISDTHTIQPKKFLCPNCTPEKKQTEKELNGLLPNTSKEGEEDYGYNRNRKCTDLFALLALVSVIISFVIVVLCLGGLRAIGGAGYDSCGNVCGEVNFKPRENHKCMSSDLTDKGLVMFVNYIGFPSDLASSPRECVSTCPKNMLQIFDYCIHFGYQNWSIPSGTVSPQSHEASNLDSPGDFIQYILTVGTSEMLSYDWIIRIWLLCTVVSYFTVMIFCNFPLFSVWTVDVILRTIFLTVPFYVCYILLMFGGIGLVWILALNIIILIFNVRQIAKGKWKVIPHLNRFMAALHYKATVVIFSVPAFLFVAVLTIPVLAGVVVIWCKIALWIESANQIYTSFHDTGATLQSIARWLNIILGIWTIEMVFNCQRMVIAGAVSHWHFAKVKLKLGWPLLRSFFVVIRYHLGTIAMGSVIFFPILFIKFSLECLFKPSVLSKRRFVVALVALNYRVTDLLAILLNPSSDLSFNESALTGESYCKSLSRSMDRQAAINNSYWLLHVRTSSMIVPLVIRSFIMFVTVVLAFFLFDLPEKFIMLDEEQNCLTALVIILAVSFVTAHTFWSFYQIIIEQLYICVLHEKSIKEESTIVKADEKSNTETEEILESESVTTNPVSAEAVIIDLTPAEENEPVTKLPDKVEV